jgi:hypothetical protein
VRTMRRASCAGHGRPRCMVARLSHMTTSPLRQNSSLGQRCDCGPGTPNKLTIQQVQEVAQVAATDKRPPAENLRVIADRAMAMGGSKPGERTGSPSAKVATICRQVATDSKSSHSPCPAAVQNPEKGVFGVPCFRPPVLRPAVIRGAL